MDPMNNHGNGEVFYGSKEPATYKDPIIPVYQGNPLIEALPPILEKKDVARKMSKFPDYDPSHREQPEAVRLHLAMSATGCFQPLSWHLELERNLSRVLRMGYQNRNPLQRGYWPLVDSNVSEVAARELDTVEVNFNSTLLGFAVLGISGIGKTRTLQHILSTYPQVIVHTTYQSMAFTWIQIVWLKLDCPHDGSIKGLCLAFFSALDNLLGTDYYRTYAQRGRATVDALITAMARLTYIHSIGLLIIDEIQNLNEARSGGAARMLNFFTQLVNTVGMPVITVGTPKARRFLVSEFRQARRSAGQGDFVVNPMEQDEEWDLFMRAIWRYQYTRKVTPLTPDLSDAIYYESAGVCDIAVKLYTQAQTRAIESDLEEVTPNMIRSVARDHFSTMYTMLQALRTKNWAQLDLYEDLQPIGRVAQVSQQMAQIKDAEAAANRQPAASAPKADDEADEAHLSAREKQKRRKSERFQPPKGTLMAMVEAGRKHEVAAYETLRRAGFIRQGSEFSIGQRS